MMWCVTINICHQSRDSQCFRCFKKKVVILVQVKYQVSVKQNETMRQIVLMPSHAWSPINSYSFVLNVNQSMQNKAPRYNFLLERPSAYFWAALAIVLRALPFLNHSIWASLKGWERGTSKALLPSLGWTTIVMGLPTASSVERISTCAQQCISTLLSFEKG